MSKLRSSPYFATLTLVAGILVAVAGSVLATSIGTNVSVSGTLTASALTTLANASTTNLSTSGNFMVNGYATTTASNGNIATAGTLTVTGASSLSTLAVSGLTTLANASTTLFSATGNVMVNGYATTTASNGNFATEGSVTIGTGGTAVTKHLSGTASLNFPIIAANSCQTLPITVTGAAAGDPVVLGLPDALANASTTFAWSGWVSGASTVQVRVCQVAGQATSDPAAATVRVDVWQH